VSVRIKQKLLKPFVKKVAPPGKGMGGGIKRTGRTKSTWYACPLWPESFATIRRSKGDVVTLNDAKNKLFWSFKKAAY